MSTSRERQEKIKMIMSWVEDSPSLNVVGRGLVTLSIEDAHNSSDYKEVMKNSDAIIAASKKRLQETADQ